MTLGSSGVGGEFVRAVGEFEAAVAARDPEATGAAFDAIRGAFGGAGAEEVREGGPRLAGTLTGAPDGMRGVIAVVVGACVERGADPGACAPGVFAGMRAVFEDVLEFCARWEESGGGDFPDPEEHPQGPGDDVVERFGFAEAIAWWTVPQWQMAAFAVLGDVRGRQRASYKRELEGLLARVGQVSGWPFKGLVYALRVLDEEPVVVLDRTTRAGFLVRIGGIGDNFQLHTLLAEALIGGGHLAGEVPSAEAVAVCRDVEGQVLTYGSFEFVGADGVTVWNEGNPADIPVVGGARVLVLDPPPYRRSWPAGRYFPAIPGGLVLERVLGQEETEGWFGYVSPAQGR
ncbi:hypothetical protein ACIO3O_40645 [Streptomyces sp. NPDC087440]|uniref:hypothetical protein n=1 Tax=Streptomyces sp. NPDC087440 TaxID=3365790 RepID=UPI00382808B3